MTDTLTKANAVGAATVAAFDETKAELQRAAARRQRRPPGESDDELVALTACSRALADLPDEARARVLLYLVRRHEPRPDVPSPHPVSQSHPPHPHPGAWPDPVYQPPGDDE